MASLSFPHAGVSLQYHFIYNYIQNKKFRVGKLELFRFGRVTGDRDTFFGLNISKNGCQKVVTVFCLPCAAGRIGNKIN